MDTTAARGSEVTEAPKAQASPEKHASQPHPVDKFAEARRAKKKAKRVTHRAKLKRSNTNG
jgi:hypothetical protein